MYSFQAVPQAVQNNTQVKHHSEVTLNALNAEVDVEGSLDFDSTPPNVWKRKSQFFCVSMSVSSSGWKNKSSTVFYFWELVL